MIFSFGNGGDWLGDSDYSLHRTRCWKCDGLMYYRRDGGPAWTEKEATAIVCPYCGYNHSVSRRYDG
jgi:uncharacterized protein CbrC (UPF0167 family)